jgi:hypothetical protein
MHIFYAHACATLRNRSGGVSHPFEQTYRPTIKDGRNTASRPTQACWLVVCRMASFSSVQDSCLACQPGQSANQPARRSSSWQLSCCGTLVSAARHHSRQGLMRHRSLSTAALSRSPSVGWWLIGHWWVSELSNAHHAMLGK